VLSVATAGARVVHCCAEDVPVDVLGNSGADAISLDAGKVRAAAYDALGEAVEAGASLWLGVLAPASSSFDAARDRLRALWSELGFPLRRLATDVVATPACGLAGASPDEVRSVFRALRDLAKWLPEAAEDDS
jgi:hypothetical protein